MIHESDLDWGDEPIDDSAEDVGEEDIDKAASAEAAGISKPLNIAGADRR